MTSMYERRLGDDYERLHPKLQQRYRLTGQAEFIGEGVMDEIKGGSKWIRPWLRLGILFRIVFPERGRHIPFVIHNRVRCDRSGREIVEWNRTFEFMGKKRHFDAVMMWDDRRGEVMDWFGRPPLLLSSLDFRVDAKGAMHISSKKQWLPFAGGRIPLPKFLYGVADIVESYDDGEGCFHIHVQVRNRLVGTLFEYSGTFREVQEESV